MVSCKKANMIWMKHIARNYISLSWAQGSIQMAQQNSNNSAHE